MIKYIGHWNNCFKLKLVGNASCRYNMRNVYHKNQFFNGQKIKNIIYAKKNV